MLSYSKASEEYYSDLGETTFLNSNRYDSTNEVFAKNNSARVAAATGWAVVAAPRAPR